MRKRLMVVLTGLALLATVTGCGNDKGATAGPALPDGSTAQAIQKRGFVRVGTKYDQPGFGNKSMTDQPEGFDVEVAKIIAKGIFGDDLGDRVRFEEAQTPHREEYIEQDKVDYIVATYSITDERKNRVSFAGPYLIAGQGLLVKKSDNSVTGPDTLAGKKVCSAQGSTPLKRIQQMAPQADTSLVFTNYADCVEALKDGRVDVVTTDDQILLGYASENDGLKVVGKPFSQELYGVGLKKDDKGFRDFINDQLDKAFKDGSWAKAYDSTIGARTGTPAPPAPTLQRY